MGESKRRRDALRVFQPLEPDFHVCPACRSRRTHVEEAPAMALSHVPTLLGLCLDCKTLWEAFPPGWSHDVVGADPCDNCAFSAGSPESQDRAEWRGMLARLKAGQEFKCHKGAPIIVNQETGTVEFDETWVRTHGRTCVGFHRAIMTKPSWMENRYGDLVHVLTKHDQDKLLHDAMPEVRP